ncbi:MAG TPA: DUF1592 domain-containing protein [Polyangiaceae bacterium]|nr:DUF1592 domain-containing protein [Polyangiaceae bacterium]
MPNGSAGGSSVPNGTAGDGSVGLPPSGTCVPGIPVTTQIPMMLNRQYANVVRDLLGVTDVGGQQVTDLLVGDAGTMTAPAWKVYQDVAEKIAAQVMAGSNKSKFISCQPSAADCLQSTIKTFGRKAFRRALTDEEVASFMTLNSASPAGTPDQVAEAILNAFLVSPSFLLIPELATDKEPNAPTADAIKLSPQEVATRLSFLLWGSIPDDELNTAAEGNQLSTKEQILAQATRMIQVRPKTGGFITAFHDDWAQMNNSSAHWFKGKHDTTVYPDYTDASQVANRKELDQFFEEVAYTGGSFKDLLTSNIAFVNQDNAVFYGLDKSKFGADFVKTTLDSTTNPRPGFLTRAGFLSSYSSFKSTSPILRGSFMAIWLLSIDVPAPDPSFAMTKFDGTYTTQREYVEKLTQTNQPCKGCHEVFNPLGFVMENYDGVGKWQTKDPVGGDINTKATVNFGNGVPSKELSSPVDLMNAIADAPKAKELYAQAWVSFATGRAPNGNDKCTVDALQTKLMAGGYTILNLLGDLTQTDSFRLRVRGAL